MSHDTAAKDREGEPETTGEPAPGPRDVLLTISKHLWEQARDTQGSNWPPPWLVLAVAGAGVGVVLMLIVPVVRGLLFAAGDSIAALSGWAHEQAYAQIVLAPVRRYLDTHAEGLPIPAVTLWWTWCITGMVLLAMCLLHVVAARIGWVLYGAATTAMVASATPGNGRWIAAALSGVWWVLLSIPAFGRHRAAPVLMLPAPPPAQQSRHPGLRTRRRKRESTPTARRKSRPQMTTQPGPRASTSGRFAEPITPHPPTSRCPGRR
ncbi:hypothetical protein EEZ25_24455 [Micromonospora aurantiaca]|uniref:hypothetical protein n=1 Tax=Micromonospora aurantiaca (nom. illeg.) TaxID=47850 RepID=UPI000F3CB906|nr:hypothetical protein [Micromonospora aurantiaca]RNH98853.1 hypothetical protein EEZ25_24455 [Micromonospora aurantiaca]